MRQKAAKFYIKQRAGQLCISRRKIRILAQKNNSSQQSIANLSH